MRVAQETVTAPAEIGSIPFSRAPGQRDTRRSFAAAGVQ